MFRIRDVRIDSYNERIFFIHEGAVREGALGFQPLDRVRIVGEDPVTRQAREVTGILNFCADSLVAPDEIGLSRVAFGDLEFPEGTHVRATLAPSPHSVDRVRSKLSGERLEREDFDAIIADVVAHRYSKVELSMFVLACALRRLDSNELIDLTRAMLDCGTRLDFGRGPIADKHCIGGIPGNRTTMVLVPILASLGVTIPKTSSRAITSPAGTADTMGVLAETALSPSRMHEVVSRVGACIAWGGALGLAPADDIMITVERPMGIDTEAQMVASILAKKKTAGATHALIDVPVGDTAKIRTRAEAEFLAGLFRVAARAIEIELELVFTQAQGPIGSGIGPRLEALDVLSVLERKDDAPLDLREKSLYLAARSLEMVGAVPAAEGYRRAQQALDSGRALHKFQEIVDAQGRRELPGPAPQRRIVEACGDGRVRAIDCWVMAKIAKLAGAPTHPSSGVRLLRKPGDVVSRGDPLFEIHAQSAAQLEFACEHADLHPGLYELGY